jgi:hypothetical protein
LAGIFGGPTIEQTALQFQGPHLNLPACKFDPERLRVELLVTAHSKDVGPGSLI